jgi:hypothetical protein
MTYGQLRELLDGPVEYVYFDDGQALLVNEAFKFRNFALNLRATTRIDGHHDKLHGPAILMAAEEFRRVKECASGENCDD